MMFRIRIELPTGMEKLPDKELVIRIDDDNGLCIRPKSTRSKSDERLLPFMRNITEELLAEGRERTAETYMSTLRSFKEFMNGKDIAIGNITCDTTKRYEQFLRQKGLSLNTVSFYMRVLRAVYNKAVIKGKAIDIKPFRNVYTGIAKTRKRALTIEALRAMKRLEPKSDAMAFARDMFMFSLYTRGMSFADMAALRHSNIRNGELVYTRKKTGQRIRVKWEKCMQDIVERHYSRHKEKVPGNDDFLLPIAKDPETGRQRRYKSVQCMVNYQLKNIAAILGITNGITMYAARHSWASMAKNMNIPLYVISDSMGHHSQNTTQIYLDTIDSKVIDRANMKIIKAI